MTRKILIGLLSMFLFLSSGINYEFVYAVDDENVDKVRNFVSGLGKEFLAVFDYEWSKDNDQRIIKLYNQSEKPFTKRLTNNGNK